MAMNAETDGNDAPLAAITISRDVQEFDLLIEDMETELGEAWGDLTFEEAAEFLHQPEADDLSVVVLAVDGEDEGDLNRITAVIRQAKKKGLRVILVADGLGPLVMHDFLRAGVDDFTPYPLPENALAEALQRVAAPRGQAVPEELRQATEAAEKAAATAKPETERPDPKDRGPAQVHAFTSIAGGAGASTIAVNAAWEVAFAKKSGGPSVCLLDLGLQFGSVATYMDLPRRESIYEILSDTSAMDEQAFRQALQPVRDRIHVFTAPTDMLPLELIGPDDVVALMDLARDCFDVVILDVPGTLTQWTDAVLTECDRFHVVTTMEVRAAQNALRLSRLLEAEGIPTDTMSWVLNKAPGRTDFQARGRIAKMADSLGLEFDAVLPWGGQTVTEANDQALPLMQAAPRNPFRKELAKLGGTMAAGIERAEATPAKARGGLLSRLGLRFG